MKLSLCKNEKDWVQVYKNSDGHDKGGTGLYVRAVVEICQLSQGFREEE